MPNNELLLFVLFNLFILFLLLLDLGVFHRKDKEVTLKEAGIWSAIWIILSLLFNLALFFWVKDRTGSAAEATRVSLEFLTGYLMEKALSVDNIFVFIVIFSYFGVPPKYHHRVLFWGVLGALIMRGIFIALGAALIARFDWILYIFGIILIVSGWKMAFSSGEPVHPEKNLFIRLAKRFFRVHQGFDSHHFFVRLNGKIHITTLFLVLITVETTDVVFAVDSIPAVFGITRDPFIVYSSNVFAILGLRALYFLLAGVMNTFYYLKFGLSFILVFIGCKMLVEYFVHIPIAVSLAVVGSVLALAVAASLVRNRRLRVNE
ncbi:MAG TPA: TerC family protein [Bacteroidota bacterium]|nr:TerC family protein [Bacteroidota bacterium]